MIRDNTPPEECVGCGYCCIQRPCACGKSAHPEAIARGEICPSLHWNGERYMCKLMMLQGDGGEFYKWQLHAGQGCLNFLNPWRKDVRERKGKEG